MNSALISLVIFGLLPLAAFALVVWVDLRSVRIQARNANVLADAAALELSRAQARNMRFRAYVELDDELRSGCECAKCRCGRKLLEDDNGN